MPDPAPVDLDALDRRLNGRPLDWQPLTLAEQRALLAHARTLEGMLEGRAS